MIFLKIILSLILFFFFWEAIKKKNSVSLVVFSINMTLLLEVIEIPFGKTIIIYFNIIIALLIVTIKNKNKNKNKNKSIKIEIMYILFFYFYVLISSLFSPAFLGDYMIKKLLNFTSLVIIPYIVILVSKIQKKELDRIRNFYITIGLILSLMILYKSFINLNVLTSSAWFQRMILGVENPIWLARFMIISLFFLLEKSFKKNYMYVLILPSLIAMLFIGSKTVIYIAIPIFILIIIIKYLSFKKIIYSVLLIMITLLTINKLLSGFNPDAITRRYSLKSGTISERGGRFKKILEKTTENGNYFLGNGFATSGDAVNADYNEVWYPHNSILELLYELGILGFLLYMYPLLITLYKVIKSKDMNIFAMMVILYFLFSLTSGDIARNNFYFLSYILFIKGNKNKKNKKIKFLS